MKFKYMIWPTCGKYYYVLKYTHTPNESRDSVYFGELEDCREFIRRRENEINTSAKHG